MNKVNLKYMYNRNWMNWEPNNEYNLFSLVTAEMNFNHILDNWGNVPLYLVLWRLGYPLDLLKPWMMLLGWGKIYKNSDDFIDFKLWSDGHVHPKEDYIMIDFSGCGQIEVNCSEDTPYWCPHQKEVE